MNPEPVPRLRLDGGAWPEPKNRRRIDHQILQVPGNCPGSINSNNRRPYLAPLRPKLGSVLQWREAEFVRQRRSPGRIALTLPIDQGSGEDFHLKAH